MSLDEPPILNNRSHSPNHPGEIQGLQLILEKEGGASHQLDDLELEGITDVSQQSQSEISSDQSGEVVAKAPDHGELVADESGGVEIIEMAPSVTRDVDFWELFDMVQIDNIKVAMEFICGLESASLDEEEMGLGSEVLECLQHPPQHQIEAPSSNVHLAIDLYLAIKNASQDTYNAIRAVILHCYPDSKLLSYTQTKTKITQMTGITPLVHNMCINSCLAYTGPFSTLKPCPTCGKSQYDQITLESSEGKVKKPQQEFHTIPIGLQLQALW